MDSIWNKVMQNSQYHDKSIQDLVGPLEYQQFILMKFDLDGALEEGVIICYFWKGSKPSVRVELE